jgi:hypothetical protein
VDGRKILAAIGLSFPAGLAACAMEIGNAPPDPSTASATMPVACDPLAPTPITLGAVVGVGVDSDGTLYVDAENGVFVATGAELDRQHVTGTGQSGANEYLFSFEPPADSAAGQTLLVETDAAGAAQAMALDSSGSRSFLDEAGSGRTALTLIASASVAALPVVNTPNQIDYVADVENGDILLATVPMDPDPKSESGGLAIFYGTPDNVEERKITAFGQSLSGTGSVTFLVDSDSYVLAFGRATRGDSPLGDFTLNGLTPGTGATLAVTLRSPTPTELPSGVAFSCLQ